MVDNASSDDSVNKISDYASGKLRVSSDRVEYRSDNKPIGIASFSGENEGDAGEPYNEGLGLGEKNRLILIKNEKNLGFAEGNNVGIRFAMRKIKPDYILLLNNDTVVDKQFLVKLVETAESDSKIAAVGPNIYYYSHEGGGNVVQSAGGYVNWFLYPGYHSVGGFKDERDKNAAAVRDRDFLSGAAMMIRTDFLRFGLLDSSFFFGCEDVAFCLRLKRNGGRVVIRLDSFIWHKCGISRKKNPELRTGREIGTLYRGVIYNLRLTRRVTRGYVIYIPSQLLHLAIKLVEKKIFRSGRTHDIVTMGRE